MNNNLSPKILVVDDEKPILDALYRFCRQRKWEALRANSGVEALELLDSEHVDIIISDMRMPNMDGAEFLSKAREKCPDSVRILLTGYADMEAVISAVNHAKIYNYLTKPWEDPVLESIINSAYDFKLKEDERKQLTLELAELNHVLEEKVLARTKDLQEAMDKTQESNRKITRNFKESLSLISSVIEMQDGSKANYSSMIAKACVAIAKALELSPKEIEQIRIAALLHNIGKLALPEALCKKPMDQLGRVELASFHRHPIQGEAVLSGMTGLKTVAKLVRSHQEHLDGSGFPDKLREDAIPIGAKIICVASDFKKLESNLLLNEISGPKQAIEHIKSLSGKHYDARIVALFDQYYQQHLQDYRSYLSQLSLTDVKAGMILAENLMTPSGLLLLTKDSIITEEHLSHFATYENDIGGKLIFPILNSSIDSIEN